ncbi:MAG: DegT/DnrJ/EryC1/StrS family aminotransferase [Candidatus Omnitrophota bacterium]
MSVPFVDFSQQYQEIKDEVWPGLEQVFDRGNFILGDQAQQFEQDFARYCDAKYGVGVNSGTDALYLSLSALGVKPGDEVILPAHTFIATALCISYAGAKPVFVDIEEDTLNIDPAAFEAAITSKTRAVIPVHIYGQPANMDEIVAVARQHNIRVIEDAAQAHGAVYKDRRTGSLGDAACFSFYPTKNLGAAGDGGMVVTNDEKVYENLRMLRDYGRKGRYEHKVKGHNSRLDTVQAVVLTAKLKRLDQWNQMRRQVAAWYAEAFSGIQSVTLPLCRGDRSHVYHLYVIHVPERDKVLANLKERDIGALIHYPIPVHLQEAYHDAGYSAGDFPVAEKTAGEILSLPMFPHMTKEQVKCVADCLKGIL